VGLYKKRCAEKQIAKTKLISGNEKEEKPAEDIYVGILHDTLMTIKVNLGFKITVVQVFTQRLRGADANI
jgi:hypothetical protein